MTRAVDPLVDRRHRIGGSRCTGVCAHWCPVHGTCTCPYDEGWVNIDACDVATGREIQLRLHDPTCPLHGLASLHAA